VVVFPGQSRSLSAEGVFGRDCWSMSHVHALNQVPKSEGNLFRLAVVSHTYQGIVPGGRHPYCGTN